MHCNPFRVVSSFRNLHCNPFRVVSSLRRHPLVGLKQPGRTAELKVEPSGIAILVRVEIRIWDQKSRDVDIVIWDDGDIRYLDIEI